MPGADLARARELRVQGRPHEAIKALEAHRDDFHAMLEMADLLHAVGMPDRAAETLEPLAAAHPTDASVHRLLAAVLLSAGRLPEAERAYARVMEILPGDPGALAGRASALHRAGRHDEAIALLEPRLNDNPPHEAIATAFARLAKRAGRLGEALPALRRALEDPGLIGDRRASALHALGDVLDAIGMHDDAFRAHHEANTLRATPFNAEAQERLCARIRQVYTGAPPPNSGRSTEAPVFIIGMPRSGTSLVEQVLASHPAVRAGGERDEIRRIVISLPHHTTPPTPFPDAARVITRPALAALADSYTAPLIGPCIDRITDKMPMNFMALGLIAQLFPRARVIHCARHPLDTCLSCFFSNFAGAHPYTRDLTALGRFFGQYRRMMSFWADTAPLPILEVRYESLVADQEAGTHALLDFLGLPWNDACLRFHESPRAVNTASFDQVRRPMHTGSVGRWKPYATHLAPLIGALRAEGVDPDTG